MGVGTATLFYSSFGIDVATLTTANGYKSIKKILSYRPFRYVFHNKHLQKTRWFRKYEQLQRLNHPEEQYENLRVSVIIPGRNMEDGIARSVESVYKQTVPPDDVIIADDFSTDRTPEICRELQKKHPITYVRQEERMWKIANVNSVINNMELKDLTLILDGDTYLREDFIENARKHFRDKKVVIVSGVADLYPAKSFKGKIILHGEAFLFKAFNFRKTAQDYRNAISVVCGDSATYRTSFLKDEMGGLPYGTCTEDTDITWEALERGYRVRLCNDARALSTGYEDFKRYFRQIKRWFSGTWQCSYKHGKRLLKSKSLALTNILPVMFESCIYTPSFVTAPFLLPFFPDYALGFIGADLAITLMTVGLTDRKSYKYLPEIYLSKFIWGVAYLAAGIKTTVEYLKGQRYWTYPSAKGKVSEPSKEIKIEKPLSSPEKNGSNSEASTEVNVNMDKELSLLEKPK